MSEKSNRSLSYSSTKLPFPGRRVRIASRYAKGLLLILLTVLTIIDGLPLHLSPLPDSKDKPSRSNDLSQSPNGVGADPVPDLSLPQTVLSTIDNLLSAGGVIETNRDNLTLYNNHLALRLLGGARPHDELLGLDHKVVSSWSFWEVDVQVGGAWVPLAPTSSSFTVLGTNSSGTFVTRAMRVGNPMFGGDLLIGYAATSGGPLKWSLSFSPYATAHYMLTYTWKNITGDTEVSNPLRRIVTHQRTADYTMSWDDVPSSFNVTDNFSSPQFSLAIDLGNLASKSTIVLDPNLVSSSVAPGASAFSSQRKVFFEPKGGNYWVFYFDGYQIRYKYSADGLNWNLPSDTSGQMPTSWPSYNSADISLPPVLNIGQTLVLAQGESVYATGVPNNGYVLGHLYYIVGTISGNSISWSQLQTAGTRAMYCFSGSGSCTISGGLRDINVALTPSGAFAFSFNSYYISSPYPVDTPPCSSGTFYSESVINIMYNGQTLGIGGQAQPLGGCYRFDLNDIMRSVLLTTNKGVRIIYQWVDHTYDGPGNVISTTISLDTYTYNTLSSSWEGFETLDSNVGYSYEMSGVTDSDYGTHILYRMPDGTVNYAFRASTATSSMISRDIFSGSAGFPTITVDSSNNDLYAFAIKGSSVVLKNKAIVQNWSDKALTYPVSNRNSPSNLGSNFASVGGTNASRISIIWVEGSSPYNLMYAGIPIPSVWSPFSASRSPWDGNGIVPYGQYFANLGEYVSPNTGMLTVRQSDLSVPGRGPGLDFSRVYTEPSTFVEGPFGFRDDTFLSGWSQTTNGIFNLVSEKSDGDVLTITGGPGSSGDDYRTWIRSGLSLDTNAYPYLIIRWKTSAASSGLGVGIVVVFSDGSSQTPQPTDATSFSTNWVTRSYLLQSGKTVSQLQLFANDNPDSLSSGTYSVYYDYAGFARSYTAAPLNYESSTVFRDDDFRDGWTLYGPGTLTTNGDIGTITVGASPASPEIVKNVNINTAQFPYLVWRLQGKGAYQVGVQVGGTEYKYSYPPDPPVPSAWTTIVWNVRAVTGSGTISQIKLWAVGNAGTNPDYVQYDFVAISRASLGNGWQLNFPWLSQLYLHLWDGQGYRIPSSFWTGLTATYENHAGENFRLVRYIDGTFTLYDKSGTIYRFDSSLKLLTMSDSTTFNPANPPANNTIAFNYDLDNRLTSINDTMGRLYKFYYDAALPMLLKSINQTLSGGTGSLRGIVFAYDSRLDLVSVTDPAGRVTTYAYQAAVEPAIQPWILSRITYPTGWYTDYGFQGFRLGTEIAFQAYRVGWQAVQSNVSSPVRQFGYTYVRGPGDQIIASSVKAYDGTAARSTVWAEDAAPLGATEVSGGVSGAGWDTTNPMTGTQAIHVPNYAGAHQYYWYASTQTLVIPSGSRFFVNMYIPTVNTPDTIQVQVRRHSDGTWFRAHWGPNAPFIPALSKYAGLLPAARNQWVRLEVDPASLIGAPGDTGTAQTLGPNVAIDGFACSLNKGEAWCDSIGTDATGVQFTDYAFSAGAMTRLVSDSNHNLVSGVQDIFGVNGQVVKEIVIVTGNNPWLWSKTSPATGWNSIADWSPASSWSLAHTVLDFGHPSPPWGQIAGWQDTQAKWIWWSPDAATSSTTEPVWFRRVFNLNSQSSLNIEVTVDDSFTLYVDGNTIGTGNNWQNRYLFSYTSIPSLVLGPGSHVLAISANNIGGPAALLLSAQDSKGNVLFRTGSHDAGSYTNTYRYDPWGNLIYSHRAIDPSATSYHDSFYAYYNDGLPLGFYYFYDTFSQAQSHAADNTDWTKDYIMPSKTPDPCCQVRMTRQNMYVSNGWMHFDVDGYPVGFYFYSPQIPISGNYQHWTLSFDWKAHSGTGSSSVTNLDVQLKFSNGTRFFVQQLAFGGATDLSGSYSADLSTLLNDGAAHGNNWVRIVWHIEDGWDFDWGQTGDIDNVFVSPGATFTNSFIDAAAPGPSGLNTWVYTRSQPSTGWNLLPNWTPSGGWSLAQPSLDYNHPNPPWGTITNWQDAQAQWIWWNPDAWISSTVDSLWFRRAFNLKASTTLTIEITVDDTYYLYVDGTSLGSDTSVNGWTTREAYSKTLGPGPHVLAVQASNVGGAAGLLLSARDSSGQVIFRSDGAAGPNIPAVAGVAETQNGSVPQETYNGYTGWGAIAQSKQLYLSPTGNQWLQTTMTYDSQYGTLKTQTDPEGNVEYYSYSPTFKSGYLTNKTQVLSGLTPTLSSDFNAGNYNGWTVGSGTWSVTNGELGSSGTGDESISTGSTNWQTTFVQAQVKALSGQDYSIDFLWNGGSNNYRMQTDNGYQTLHLYKAQSGVYNNLATATLSGIISSQWHTWRIEVTGGNIRLFIDGIEKIQYIDQTPYTTGLIRFRTLNSQVHFDNVLVSTGKLAVTRLYNYDQLTGSILSSTDSIGNSTSYTYDSLGRLTRANYPTGAQTYTLTLQGYDYDGAGEETLTLNGQTLATLPTVNSPQNAGIYVSFTVPMNSLIVQGTNTLTFTHAPWDCGITDNTKNVQVSSNGLMIFSDPTVRPLSCTQSITYVFTVGPDFVAYTYNDAGNYVEVTNENGWKTRQVFDGLGRLATVDRFSSGASYANATSSYDWADRRTTSTDELGRTYRTQYDVQGRILNVTKPDLNVVHRDYDDLNLWVRTTNEDGNYRCTVYDHLGRPISVIEKASILCQTGLVTNYYYDEVGNLVKVTGSNLQSTTRSYDNLNRITRITNPDGSSETYTYDNSGDLQTKVDEKGIQTIYSYDSLYRLKTTTRCGTTPSSENYTYDKNGRIVRIESQNATVTYQYDKRNRPLSENYAVNTGYKLVNLGCPTNISPPNQGTSQSYTISYSYMGESLRSIVYPDGLKANYTYDGLGRTTSVFTPGGTTYATFSYSLDDHIKGIGFGNTAVANYTYDSLARPSTITLKKTDGTVLISLTYGYNRTGTVSSVTGQVNQASIAESYRYDQLGRLINSTVTAGSTTNTLWYTYDAVGNRLQQSLNHAITTYTYNQFNNEVTSSTSTGTSTVYSYDKNYNLATKNVTTISTTRWTYSWDTAGRLTKVVNDGTTKGIYAYDSAGRRIESIEGTSTKYYGYLGTETAYEISAGISTDYVFAASLRVAKVSGTTKNYYHQDALGSTRLVTDANANVIFADNYQPFGQDNGTVTGSETYRFTGKPWSSATGLFYLFQRWYDPSLGRFISADPLLGSLFNPQTLNRFLYIANDPASQSDPSGLDCGWNPFSWGDCAKTAGQFLYDNTVGAAVDSYNWYMHASDADRRAFWIGVGTAVAIGVVVGLSCAFAGCAGLVLLAVGFGTTIGGSFLAGKVYQAAGGTSEGGLRATTFWGGIGAGLGFSVGFSIGDLLSEPGEIAAGEPGTNPEGSSSSNIAANRAKGIAFEEHVAKSYGEVRNVGPGQLRVVNSEGTYIPDFRSGAEAKAVLYLSKTSQMRVALENAAETKVPLKLYVLQNTELSGPMEEAVANRLIALIRVPFYG